MSNPNHVKKSTDIHVLSEMKSHRDDKHNSLVPQGRAALRADVPKREEKQIQEL